MSNDLTAFYDRIATGTETEQEYHENTLARSEFYRVDLMSSFSELDDNDLIKRRIEGDSNLEDRIRYFARQVDIPAFSTPDAPEALVTDWGQISFPSKGNIIPDSNELPIGFLSTEHSVHEQFFLTWMQETVSNVWVYRNFPFTKADIEVTMFSSLPDEVEGGLKPVSRYKFYGAFPNNIGSETPTPEQSDEYERQVTFTFNNMTHQGLNTA